DLASGTANYLGSGFRDTEEGQWAAAYGPRISSLAHNPQAIFASKSLIDQRGRGDLIVFSGLYGVWLGLAVPAAMQAQEAQVYAAGMMLAPSLCVLIASSATKNADITRGQASMISLGGRLGTWQGLGWSSRSDAAGPAVL